MNKTRLLKIEDIEIMGDLYPRNTVNWRIVYKYQMAMKAGAKFPPIEVGYLNKKPILVDGLHRITARKHNKEQYIESKIIEIKNDADVLKKAIEINTRHGLALTQEEMVKAVLTLRDLKYSNEEISHIISVPLEKLETYVNDRLMLASDTNSKLVLKKPLKRFSEMSVDDKTLKKMEHDQERMATGQTQEKMIDDFLLMLENNYFDMDNEKVKKKLFQIYDLLFTLKKR